MGAMAAFGLISGVKGAAFAPNTSADRTSSTFSEQRAAPRAAGFSRELATEINAATGDGDKLFTIAIRLSVDGNDALATGVFKMAYDAGDASSAIYMVALF